MHADVLRRDALDERRSTIAWAGAIALLVAIYLVLYPTIRHSGIDLQKLFDQMPPALRDALLGPNGDYLSPTGYVGAELFAFMLPVLFLVVTLIYSTRAIAGEEAYGTLDLLLATPIARKRLVVEKAIAALIPVFLLAAVVLLVVAAIGPAVGITVNLGLLVESLFALALMACVFGAIGLAVTAARGSRGLAAGAAGGLAVVLYALNAVAPSVPALQPVAAVISPFHWAGGPGVLATGVQPVAWLGLVLTPFAFVAMSLPLFERRDVGG